MSSLRMRGSTHLPIRGLDSDSPGSRSRTSQQPRRRGRLNGNARYKRGNRARRAPRRLSYRSDTSTSYGNLNQWRGREVRDRFGGWQQRAHDIVIVRFGDAEAANLALTGLVAFEVVDQRHAVDLWRLRGEAAFPQKVGLFR